MRDLSDDALMLIWVVVNAKIRTECSWSGWGLAQPARAELCSKLQLTAIILSSDHRFIL